MRAAASASQILFGNNELIVAPNQTNQINLSPCNNYFSLWFLLADLYTLTHNLEYGIMEINVLLHDLFETNAAWPSEGTFYIHYNESCPV